MDDENDIDRCRHNLIGKLNEVLSTYRELDSFVKVRLLKNYCLSLYGCELWNLRHASVENIRKPWRSALKSAWGLPSICRSSALEIVIEVVSLCDIICSDVKRGQSLEAKAEAEDKSVRTRTRTNLRGRGRGQSFEARKKLC